MITSGISESKPAPRGYEYLKLPAFTTARECSRAQLVMGGHVSSAHYCVGGLVSGAGVF